METPSSTRRVTRSQTTSASAGNSKNIKHMQEVRSVLLDITNDSPIVGLATGSLKTPLTSVTKKIGDAGRAKITPWSGEALLRSQVKNLLQKVEEEAEISMFPMENSRVSLFRLQGLMNGSPSAFFAPTPANTPQISDVLSESDPIVSKEQLISKVLNDIFEGTEEESVESQTCLVTRSLLLDFSEKSDVSHDPSNCSSDLIFQWGDSSSKSKENSAVMDDDDASSIWSIQVNASPHDSEEETTDKEEEEYYEEEEEKGDNDDGGFIDELYKGIEKMFVEEEKKVMRKEAHE